MGFVDGIAKQDGVDIGGMQDRGVVAGARTPARESSVEVNFGKVPLDKLIKLLSDLRAQPRVVRRAAAADSQSFDNKDVLDVSLSVSAWQGS